MKSIPKLLLGTLFLAGLLGGLSSCVSSGYVGVNDGVYYGSHRDPWFREGPWIDGNRWYGNAQPSGQVGIYLHPPRPKSRPGRRH